MAANLIPLTWKLRQGVAPAAAANQVDALDPVRIVKCEPSVSGPDGTDAAIVTKVVYNEGNAFPLVYYVEDTVAEIIALANAQVIAV